MAAKNPTISQAARKRAHERIDRYAHEIEKAQTLAATKTELGEFAGHIQRRVATLTSQRDGYEQALRDLLPERTVDTIVGGDDDADDEGGTQG